MRTATHHNQDGKLTGVLRDGVVIREVRTSRHLYRKLDAWTINAEAWARFKELGAHTIRIIDTEAGMVYDMSAKEFDTAKLPINHGWDEQWAVPRRYWRVQW